MKLIATIVGALWGVSLPVEQLALLIAIGGQAWQRRHRLTADRLGGFAAMSPVSRS